MAFAYRDRYGVLHCTKNYDNAVNYAKGKVVAGNFLCKQGYPVVYGKKVFSYSKWGYLLG